MLAADDSVAIAYSNRAPEQIDRTTYERRYENLQRALYGGAGSWLYVRPSPAAIQLTLIKTINDNSTDFDLRDRTQFTPTVDALKRSIELLGEQSTSTDGGKSQMARQYPNFYSVLEAYAVLTLNALRKGMPLTHHGGSLMMESLPVSNRELLSSIHAIDRELERIITAKPSREATADEINAAAEKLRDALSRATATAKQALAYYFELRSKQRPTIVKTQPPPPTIILTPPPPSPSRSDAEDAPVEGEEFDDYN